MTKETKQNTFTFIDVGDPSAQRRRRVANKARSHVMTELRRKQRLQRENDCEIPRGKTSPSQKSRGIDKKDGQDGDRDEREILALCNRPGSRSPKFLLKPWDPEFADAIWSVHLQQNLKSQALSSSTFVERDIDALRGYDGRVTMHLHKLINHVVQIMWPKYWPARSNEEASPLAIAWWPSFVNVPAVFHAFLYAAAVHHDDLRGQAELSQTREILAHKNEALQQLRGSLSKSSSEDIDESLVLAMTYLGLESEDNERHQRAAEQTPFNPPKLICGVQWSRHYAYAKENVHIDAATKLVDMKGGLEGLGYPLAKSSSVNDLQIAGKHLRKPHYPFWDVPDIKAAFHDPNINIIPEIYKNSNQCSGFKPLLQMGLTSEAYKVLQSTSDVSLRIELYSSDELVNQDFHPISCEKNAAHHALLSLPTAAELNLPDWDGGVYELCRIGGLLYSTGVLFPLPPSTGTPRRLVEMTKRIVENIRLELCVEGGARVLIWVLVLAGIMAQNTLERPWFLRRLKPVLAMEGIRSWDALKEIVQTFVWMDSACDEGAMCLFEDLSRPPYL